MQNSTSISLGIAWAATASLAALFTASAIAETQSTSAPQVTVSYSDLNLNTASGVQTLYKRLQQGSRVACRAYEGRDLALAAKRKACYDEALSTAVAKVHSESLTILYGKSGTQTLAAAAPQQNPKTDGVSAAPK